MLNKRLPEFQSNLMVSIYLNYAKTAKIQLIQKVVVLFIT